MQVVLAEHAGVCFGVKRALEIVDSAVERGERIATLGPIIHNPQVVDALSAKGVRAVKSLEQIGEGSVVMPSHGVPDEVFVQAGQMGLHAIDATCPFVAIVHRKAAELAQGGYLVAIVGDEGHSEVKGILSAAEDNALVLNSPEAALSACIEGGKVGVVSQTTQTPERFGEVVGAIAQRASETVAYNTICYATIERQNAARELAPKVDAMFVVGGFNSANTNRLADICREINSRTYHIETVSDIREEWLEGVNVAGLTAGASTPDWTISEVTRFLESR
jgi:(E)-4-hydroxy-3-methyl-but-2-enyl pyrophosphate reductase